MDRMMRKLAMAMVVSGALGSSFASAMGLGEIKMNSALNQPLDAEVKLLNVGDLSENEILPNLASHQDFSRAGVERVFFLTGIKFDVELDGKGGAVLHLSTDRIVREPFLNFLIELHWPSGRLLREYTALLDPPLFSEAVPAPVQQATTAAPTKVEFAPQPKTYSTPTVTQSSVQSAPTSTTSDKRDGTVRVKKNDTLWGIAKENRPDRSVTVRQTMVAIQQHNPQAFINNNINLLKSGQVLRIPEADEIRRVSSRDAYAETVRQTHEWEGKRTIDAAQNYGTAPNSVSTDQGGLLKLIETGAGSAGGSTAENASGGSATDGQAGSGGQAGDAGESGSASSVENVNALEKQLHDLQRLMTLKQEQLALLQATQADAELAAAAEEVAAVEATVVADGAEILAGDEAFKGETRVTDESLASEMIAETGVVPDGGANTSDSDAAVEADDPAAEIEAAAAQESRPEKGIMDILMNNPLYTGVLLVVTLGGLILLGAISRRRKEEKEYPQGLQETMDASGNDIELPGKLGDGLVDVDDNTTVAEPLLGNEELADDGADDARKLLDEADIYIAYGRYERAIEILQPAVNDAPENTELRLKLAEIFLASKDQARFSQQEADLQAIGNSDALAKLDELKIKYADSFDAQSEPAPESEESVAEAVVDFEAFDVEESVTEEPKDKGSFELGDLDFDLSDTDAEEVVSEAASAADSVEQANGNLVEFVTDTSDDFFDIDAEDSVETGSVDEPLEFSLDEGVDDQPQTEVEKFDASADDMDFLVDTDESATKLELAKAYIDMADTDAAQEILNEVVSEGSEDQQDEAKKLLENLV